MWGVFENFRQHDGHAWSFTGLCCHREYGKYPKKDHAGDAEVMNKVE